ncbi:hypothetical protein WMF20_07990 [Sorangium sp. So ce834]|uniref:hypothetical protein n=1 Tax=Sorangium sp. So ce834 TaxID=3133321 RepID=UPI003F5EC15B
MNGKRERTLLTSNHDAPWMRIARVAAAICAIFLTTRVARADGACRDVSQLCSGDDDKTCAEELSGVLLNIEGEVLNEIDALQKRVPATPSASVTAAVTVAKTKSDAFLASRKIASSATGTDAEKKAAAVKAIAEHCDYVTARDQANKDISQIPAPPASPSGIADPLQAQRQEIQQICTSSCKAPGAFCVDARSGEPLCDGLAPDVYSLVGALSPGDKLIVRVFGEEALRDKLKLSVTFLRSPDRRFDDRAPGGRAPARLELLAEQTAEIPEDTSITSLKIRYELAGDGPESAIDESYAVPIDQGQYYLEFGALIPLVIDGSRRVVQTTLPGAGGERRLSVEEDWSVNPSIVLNVFPGGRRRGVISSFQDMRLSTTLGDLLGVQVGVDLDLGEPFDRIFLGGVIEPVAGLGFNAGLAFVQQEYLPAGHAEDMIVPVGESVSPARRYAPRFYFGATLTLDIVTTATTATTSFASALTR